MFILLQFGCISDTALSSQLYLMWQIVLSKCMHSIDRVDTTNIKNSEKKRWRDRCMISVKKKSSGEQFAVSKYLRVIH